MREWILMVVWQSDGAVMLVKKTIQAAGLLVLPMSGRGKAEALTFRHPITLIHKPRNENGQPHHLQSPQTY